MERPSNIEELAPEIRHYIEHLEQKIQDSEEDGIRGMLIVLNRKMNQIKRSIDAYEFKIDESDNRAYERFWQAMKDFKTVSDNMKALKMEFKLTDEDLKETLSPQEQFVQRRKQNATKEKD